MSPDINQEISSDKGTEKKPLHPAQRISDLPLRHPSDEINKTIGLVIPDISNPFFAEIARLVESFGFSHGYSVILASTEDDAQKEMAYIKVFLANQMDGVIFISTGNNPQAYKILTQAGIPVVVADRDISDGTSDIVLLDNFEGGYLAGKFLLGLGHRQIACITGPSTFAPSALRLDGLLKAVAEAGLSISEDRIIRGDFHFKSGEEAMGDLLSLPVPPTAVFACNDLMAIGAIRTAHNRGISVPAQCSIIGFDNIPISRAIFPSLTTISQPYQEITRLVTNLLMSRIEESSAHKNEPPAPFQKIILHPKLIIRESCSKTI